jgi:hypothetical protein
MKGRLTAIQLDYVLEHLGHHTGNRDRLDAMIRYGEEPETQNPCICFPASERHLQPDQVIWIEEIPVLYPVDRDSMVFFSFQGKNLVFHHDLLKSIFHLLSGYEELKIGARDAYGRSPYSESLQFQLGIIETPVVNYYMQIIAEGVRQFCELNRIPLGINPVLEAPILMLSHDVDLIDAYDLKETGYKFKQLLGLAGSPYTRREKFRDASNALLHFLNPFSRENPFWNFEQLMEWESQRGFHSTYFFLEKDGDYDNSRYRFHHRRIRKLIGELSGRGHEIGIHGTMQSFNDPDAMRRTVEHLRAVSPKPVDGIRQHYLKFRPDLTARIQSDAGLTYDASLGFPEHDGFRNSYCWPCRFFDFRNNRSMDFWEIPLTFMDVTHFQYRKLSLEQSMRSVEKLAAEVVKFNGIFSLLWHNSFFNERELPGITVHYTGLLDHLKTLGLEGITGMEIIRRMEHGRELHQQDQQ